MKRLRVVLPVVLAGVVVLLGISQLSGRNEAEAFRIERQALRREAVERAAVARGAGGAAGVEEARAVLRWWLDSATALRNRHPRAAAEGERGPGAQKGKEKDKDGEGVGKRYAAEWMEALRGGYAPVASAVDQGLRLDVLGLRPGEHPDTHERMIRIDFALWGAPRRLDAEAQGPESARAALRVVVPVAFRQLGFRFIDAAGKTYGEMSGSGEPYLALKDPERFSAELPPGIVLGTWWVDRFPREAARVELSVGVQVQGMSTASLSPTFRWELPVSDAWKLQAGEAYRAETRELPPEPAAGK